MKFKKECRHRPAITPCNYKRSLSRTVTSSRFAKFFSYTDATGSHASNAGATGGTKIRVWFEKS